MDGGALALRFHCIHPGSPFRFVTLAVHPMCEATMSKPPARWRNVDTKVCVVGLGYVGLPLAIEFGKRFETTGFDMNSKRIRQLQDKIDVTGEVSAEDIKGSRLLRFTDDSEALSAVTLFIVTVPTPIDDSKRPDLGPLISASTTIGKLLEQDCIVVYESTVYPGATEEVCVPILEHESGLTFNEGFFVGYSPERINPGDSGHRLPDITKVTSGSTPEVAAFVDELYGSIITAGTHRAPSIKVAEAAKVIENTQRDLNIALVNELAVIFNKLGIDTQAVLEAAETKWNFLSFRPGLVGGHCIGVDPYYLTHKAEQIGYFPQVILAGRRINDGMSEYVFKEVVRLMIMNRIHIVDSNVLILGLAFKENCSDIRNTRVVDIVRLMESYGANVDVHDPVVNAGEVEAAHGISVIDKPGEQQYDAIILTVLHDAFTGLTAGDLRALGKPNHVLYEVKHLLGAEEVDGRL